MSCLFFFFFNDTATTEIYTLSLHDALPILHGAYSAIMQDEDGQILEAHSISAGLDYPGTGPEHAYLRDSGRARYVAVTDDEALATLRRVAELEGIIPALESSHAVTWALQPSDTLDLVCLSGRGEKYLGEVLHRLGPGN